VGLVSAFNRPQSASPAQNVLVESIYGDAGGNKHKAYPSTGWSKKYATIELSINDMKSL